MKYRTKKEEKLGGIYGAYANEIYRICLHFTKNETLAGEALQQTFFEYYKVMEEVPEERVHSFLILMARDIACSKINLKYEE